MARSDGYLRAKRLLEGVASGAHILTATLTAKKLNPAGRRQTEWSLSCRKALLTITLQTQVDTDESN